MRFLCAKNTVILLLLGLCNAVVAKSAPQQPATQAKAASTPAATTTTEKPVASKNQEQLISLELANDTELHSAVETINSRLTDTKVLFDPPLANLKLPAIKLTNVSLATIFGWIENTPVGRENALRIRTLVRGATKGSQIFQIVGNPPRPRPPLPDDRQLRVYSILGSSEPKKLTGPNEGQQTGNSERTKELAAVKETLRIQHCGIPSEQGASGRAKTCEFKPEDAVSFRQDWGLLFVYASPRDQALASQALEQVARGQTQTTIQRLETEVRELKAQVEDIRKAVSKPDKKEP